MSESATIDHPSVVISEADRFATALERGPLEAPVAACPGWDLERLTLHLGHIHRWARLAAATGTNPDPDRVPGPPDAYDAPALAEWLREGAVELAQVLASLDPDAPTWHPFPVPQVAGLWPRRQAQETLVHRWDAEAAIGEPGAIDAVLAVDGIDEYLTVMLPRFLQRGRVLLPSGALHLECVDTGDAWTASSSVEGELFVTGGVGEPHGTAEHGIARGSAPQLLLTVWGRADTAGLELDGDLDVARAWLAVGAA
jgi:uncharacterized protein (TIGR03083 family)